MKINKLIFTALIYLLVYCSCAFASDSKGALTKLFGGVRPGALGGAFTALPDDTNSIYYNPAGLTLLGLHEISLAYISYAGGLYFANISYVFPLGGNNLGLSFAYLNGAAIDDSAASNQAGAAAGPYSYAGTAAYARKFFRNVSIGGSLKLLGQGIGSSSSNGFSGDFGILWDITKWYSIGLNAKNVVGSIGGKSLSKSFAAGLSFKFNSLSFLLDGNIVGENKSIFNLGAEYSLDNITARVGYNSSSEGNSGGNLGAGVGIKLGDFKVNYAFLTAGNLGTSHGLQASYNPYKAHIPRLARIVISPENVVVRVGKTVKFTAEGFNDLGEEMDPDPTWKVDGNIGEIHYAKGVFIAQREGTGKVTAYKNAVIDDKGRKKKIYDTVKVTVYLRSKDAKRK